MKKYRSRENESDCRICGDFNGAPLKIARAITDTVLPKEKLHSHEGFEFYIFLKGKAELEINNETVIAEKGGVLLLEPGEQHKVINVLEEIDYITIKN